MDKNFGVYLCSGCGIGDAIKMEALEKVATSEYHMECCKTHECFCKGEGLELIRKDVEGGVNTLTIAACSQRVNNDVFNFGEDKIVSRVNLREHVAWSQKAQDEDTIMMAEDYLRMGIVRAQKHELPVPFLGEDLSDQILVVGGGVAGLTAALDAAELDKEVSLLERDAELGGRAKQMHKQYPKAAPYDHLPPVGVDELIKKVEDHGKVTVHKGAALLEISGQPGLFQVKFKTSAGDSEAKVGSVVQATGWKPYEAEKLEHLSYGKHPNVITNVKMEELVSAGGKLAAPNGKPIDSVAFVLCAGQRDENHLPYCSSVCCNVSLKQALYVREQFPETKVYIFYRDIRTPGQNEDFYRFAQEDEGIFLTKAENTKVDVEGDKVFVSADQTLLGEPITVEADMVVLATGMVPTAIDEGILKLQYRKGEDLPALKYGFPDSHFICFPYETQRTGIYAAGTTRAPMGMDGSSNDGTGAAFKAIQSNKLVETGSSNFPRIGDKSYPEFYLNRCTQCKRCTEECPFGTLDEDEKGTPKPNPNRCRRCGICMGSCPERIISFADYNVDMISNLIKAVEIPDEFEEKPRILAFICENDAYPALDLAGIHKLQYSPYVRVIPVRCIGSVSNVFIADALSCGYDGILLIGCKHGDDYQCHFIKGSELLGTREEKLQETLKSLVLEPERVRAIQLAISEYGNLSKIFNDYVEELEPFGPNPFKDM